MQVRSETLADRGRVATLIARTYGVEGAHVIEITGRLREENAYAEGFGLVTDGEAVSAYALFTPLDVEGDMSRAVLLAPFAVDTTLTSFDSDAFIEAAMNHMAQKGFRYVFLLGQLDELNRDKYKTVAEAGVRLATGIASSNVLVRDLGASLGATLTGTVDLPACLKE